MSKWFDGVLRFVPGVPVPENPTGNTGNPHEQRAVPVVPAVPVQNDVPGVDEMTENAIEHFEERAAIGEFDGGLNRTEAERQAASRVFEVLLTCNEGQWFSLLMPLGSTLADAKAWCIERFGPEKFIEARRYRPGGGV